MKVLTAALMIALVFAVSGFAQDRPKPELRCADRFAEIDTDKDGKVTLQEFMAVDHPNGNAEQIFKSRDTNNDGVLTQEEFCANKGMGNGKGKNRRGGQNGN